MISRTEMIPAEHATLHHPPPFLKADFEQIRSQFRPMSKNRANRRAARPHRPLSKTLLLPMDHASARELSLAHHLALVACRGDSGNKHLINELARAIYMTYFLQLAGFGGLEVRIYLRAETAIENVLARVAKGGDWRLVDDDTSVLEAVLALHDQQLATAPMHRVVDAEKRLRTFVMGSGPSPLTGLRQAPSESFP
jgi:hypothetical protein